MTSRVHAGVRSVRNAILAYSPLWLYMAFFKFGAGLHFSLESPLGARLLPVWAVGLIIGGAAFVQMLFDVPAGTLLDRFGYKKVMLIGTSLFVIGALVLAAPFSVETYLASIAFSIIGWLFFGPGINAYMLSSGLTGGSGTFMSLRDTSCSLGIVLSSAVLPIALLLPVREMGWLIAFLLVIALCSLYLAPAEHRDFSAPARAHTRNSLRELRSLFRTIKKLNPASTSILLLQFASGFFYGMIWFVVPLVIQAQAGGELLGLGLGVFDFSVVILGFVLGMLADRANKRQLVFYGLLIFAFFGMLLGLNFGIFFIFFGFLATAGEEMAGLSLWSWLYALDTDHDSDGAISGVINLFEDSGWTLAPIAAGVLYSLVGPSITIMIGSLPIFGAWVVYQYCAPAHTPHALLPRHRVPRRTHHKS